MTEGKMICQALTKAGNACTNHTAKGDYCNMHNRMRVRQIVSEPPESNAGAGWRDGRHPSQDPRYNERGLS